MIKLIKFVKQIIMKYILFFLVFTTTFFGQEVNKVDAQGQKDGLWKGIYEESKRPRYEGTFSHGKEVGKFVFFDDTKAGTIIATREFSPTDNSCYTIFYNQKGNKVSEGKLVNKLFEGEWKYYHENATTIMTSELYSKGKLEGIRKVFYTNQKIAEETTYKNGIKNGPYKKYADNGIVFEESNYKNNEFDGPAIFRNDANVVVSKGVYQNGKKVGIWEITTKGKTEKVNMNFPKQVKIKKKPITKEPY